MTDDREVPVGVGPWEGPWPQGEHYDPELLRDTARLALSSKVAVDDATGGETPEQVLDALVDHHVA